MTAFHNLFSQHVGAAFAKQLAFADFLGDRNWNVSIPQGTVTFGADLRYPIQLLGTEAERDSSWLWAWANEASNLPAPILHSCNELREMGEREGITELSKRSFPLEMADGHAISLVASGINANCCYYRGPYDGGAMFFLVRDVPSALLQAVESERAITVITEVISQFIVDHRTMAESFLKSQGFMLKSSTADTTAIRGQDSITLSFDEHRRITQIGGSLKPKQQVQKKRWWEFWKA